MERAYIEPYTSIPLEVVLLGFSAMPTVHLSLPEAVHRELKEVAEGMGIQLTDLIKVLIRDGLERLRRGEFSLSPQGASARGGAITTEELLYIEGKLHMLSETVDALMRRVERLENLIASALSVELSAEERG